MTCTRHQWYRAVGGNWCCSKCFITRDDAKSKRGLNNRKRGNAAELDVARLLGGNKVGPLGLPYDVEMPGYARLQVRKLSVPPSLRRVIQALDAIEPAHLPSLAMPGYGWVEPGRGGASLIVFRLKDFAERHGA